MSLCDFLTCRPDLVTIGFLLAVLLVPFVLVLASQLSVTIDSWGHQHTENLKKDHAAVDPLDDHSELRLSAFCFFYRHALVHPGVGMIAVILQLYAILFGRIRTLSPASSGGRSLPCLS